MNLNFSIIIPVYNRPNEIDELLQSISQQTFKENFEVLIIEDGSDQKSDKIVENYRDEIEIKYLSKPNTGAGLSRNFGMKNATGNYFIILDSDVLLPPTYLDTVFTHLLSNYTDAFGGPDTAHKNFTDLQKAINYAMTAMLTTGGLRGNKKSKSKFQPRSFNMGLSKKAFVKTGGFSDRKIGEDIDLTFRLWEHNFDTQFISDAFVYHKRRTSIPQFFKQTYAFGKERPKLNSQYPNTAKITYWFPSLFIAGFLVSLIALFYAFPYPFYILCCYLFLILVDASIKNKSFKIGLLSVLTSTVQFFGYGLGFIKGSF